MGRRSRKEEQEGGARIRTEEGLDRETGQRTGDKTGHKTEHKTGHKTNQGQTE